MARARTISRTSTLDIPLNELIVVTGVSGSGKSSLVFDTLYAEGQRRYVETFSPVRAPVPRPHGQAAGRSHRRHSAGDRHRPDQSGAHLALDRRHDDRAQRSPEAAVRARRAAVLPRLRPPVRRDTPETIYAELAARAAGGRRSAPVVVASRSPVPKNFTEAEVATLLEQQGYTRIHRAATTPCSKWCRTACASAAPSGRA